MHKMATTSPEHYRKVYRHNYVGLVSLLPDCVLAVAIALGWYIRWQTYDKHMMIEANILIVGVGGFGLIGNM
jgi:hypothetical protein